MPVQIIRKQPLQLCQYLGAYGKPIQFCNVRRDNILHRVHRRFHQTRGIRLLLSAVRTKRARPPLRKPKKVLLFSASYAGKNMRRLPVYRKRLQFKNAPHQTVFIGIAQQRPQRLVQKLEHFPLVIIFLTIIVGKFQKIKSIICNGKVLRQFPEIVLDRRFCQRVGAPPLKELKLSEGKWIRRG